MNISYNWLKRYLKTDLSAEEMATILTDIGLEVESFEKIESIRGGLAGVVVGEGLTCDERMVSICAKDSGGPYNYEVVRGLIAAAEKMGAPYAVDVYPHYGSDADAALTAGYDVRHGLIGAGVYASHGYERSHIDGVENTLELLKKYIR